MGADVLKPPTGKQDALPKREPLFPPAVLAILDSPDEVEIDMPVELDWIDADPDLTLPAFRPAAREDS